MTAKKTSSGWPKNRVEIYDTTLRDGSQAEGIAYSLEDKLIIAKKLDELGVDYIEGGYPLSNAKDEAFFKEIQKIKLKNSKIAAFGMTRRKGVKPADDTSRDLIYQALAAGQVLKVGYEIIEAEDEEKQPFTYEQFFTIVKDADSEDKVYIKAKDRTGKAKILKALQRYESAA